MKYVSGGICILFFFLLLFLLFRIWLEGRRERLSPRHIPGETLPAPFREEALRPLRRLNVFYEKLFAADNKSIMALPDDKIYYSR